MTREEMREKVAREITRVYGGDVYDKDEIAYNLPIADAVIALIRRETLEEAATMYWIHRDGKAEDIHAAIRDLKEGK